MKSVMHHDFSKSPSANIPRSVFDRSHGCKTTFDSNYLVPVYVDEALPGDTFSCSMTAFARMATPLFPIMDNLYMDSFFFAVPIRLIWDNWQRFNGEQDNPEDSTDYLVPRAVTTSKTGEAIGSLSDYLSIPTGVPDLDVCSLWHRAYNLIWNEWFRDENLQDSVVVPKHDGPDGFEDFPLLKRGKRHDYFTSVLPWPQKGPSVPILADPGVYGLGTLDKNPGYFMTNDPTVTSFAETRHIQCFDRFPDSGILDLGFDENTGIADHDYMYAPSKTQMPNSGLRVGGDGTQPWSVDLNTINTLRQAFQVQKMYERDARGGTRYTEVIRSHFGVTSPDSRLQRSEYLGGSSSAVNVNPVAQTSGSLDGETPQGNLSAFAVTTHRCAFSKSFTEHCVLIGMVSVRADLTYQQGLNRMFSRRTRFDFYWPALSHLGEQAVLNKEIYAQGWGHGIEGEADEDVFGYQERYAEYRYKPSVITGKFRSSDPASLDAWHLSQDFSAVPTLSSDFIEENVPMDRILATPSEPDFLFDSHFQLKCARPMPVYSVPGLVDHF